MSHTKRTYFVDDQSPELNAYIWFPPESQCVEILTNGPTNGQVLPDTRYRKGTQARDRPYDTERGRVCQMVER